MEEDLMLTTTFTPSSGFECSVEDAERGGFIDRRDGVSRDRCPFDGELRDAWLVGWHGADREAEREDRRRKALFGDPPVRLLREGRR